MLLLTHLLTLNCTHLTLDQVLNPYSHEEMKTQTYNLVETIDENLENIFILPKYPGYEYPILENIARYTSEFNHKLKVNIRTFLDGILSKKTLVRSSIVEYFEQTQISKDLPELILPQYEYNTPLGEYEESIKEALSKYSEKVVSRGVSIPNIEYIEELVNKYNGDFIPERLKKYKSEILPLKNTLIDKVDTQIKDFIQKGSKSAYDSLSFPKNESISLNDSISTSKSCIYKTLCTYLDLF